LLDSSLLHKSFVLGATGAWLLASAWVLKRSHGVRHDALAGADSATGAGAAARDGNAVGGAHAAHAVGAAGGGKASVLWRRGGLVAGLLIVLAVAHAGIYEREQILAHGRRVVLELAPVDPRSLMQGDYMRLNFDVANKVQTMLMRTSDPLLHDIERRRGGLLVLRPDAQGVHHLVAIRAAQEGPLQIDSARENGNGQDDVFLEFRLRGGRVRVVTDAWFFPEGRAAHFERARYGEFRVDEGGAGLLTGLLDNMMQPLTR